MSGISTTQIETCLEELDPGWLFRGKIPGFGGGGFQIVEFVHSGNPVICLAIRQSVSPIRVTRSPAPDKESRTYQFTINLFLPAFAVGLPAGFPHGQGADNPGKPGLDAETRTLAGEDAGNIAFDIPIAQKARPGLTGVLRIEARSWS